MLHGSDDGIHGCHDGGHDNHEHHHDHNLRAAYLHVAADALTSVLAIVVLIVEKFSGWSFLDPVIGIVGGILIARRAWGSFEAAR